MNYREPFENVWVYNKETGEVRYWDAHLRKLFNSLEYPKDIKEDDIPLLYSNEGENGMINEP